jgi:hypothetical protein
MAITTYSLPSITSWKLAENIAGIADLGAIYTAGLIGSPGINATTGLPLPSAVVMQQLGTIITGISYDSTYGGSAKFIFLAIPTSTTTTQGLAYKWKGDFTIEVVATAVSSQAQSGVPVAIALNSVTSNTTSVQYAWFLVQGKGAAIKSVSITAQPNVPLFVSGATAGRVRTTASIYRTYIGMRSANTSTATGSILPVYLNFPNVGPGI